jgi:branched-chain amino acid aminotransferase
VWVQLDDRIVPEAEARVSVFDRGFMYGDSVFETFRVYNGCPFRLEAHLGRMARTAAALRMELPRSSGQIGEDVGNVLDRNGLKDAVVRIQASRGRGARGPGIRGVTDPAWVVAAWPLPEDLGDRRSRGARLCTVSTRRPDPSTLPPDGKLGNYLNSVLAAAEASERDCDEALMLTPGGMLAECAGANFFFVSDEIVRTPALGLGVLPGVTRAVVLELAARGGLRIAESAYPPGVLDDASEVFVTNSLVGVWPVRSVDQRGYGVPGPLTSLLLEEYRERVFGETGGRH